MDFKIFLFSREKQKGDQNLVVFEACTDVTELLVDAESLGFLVLAISDVAYEDGETSHPAHGRNVSSDPPR